MINQRLGSFRLGKQGIGLVFFALLGLGMLISPMTSVGQSLENEGTRCEYKPIHGAWYIGSERGSYTFWAVERDLTIIRDRLCANYIALQANVYQQDKYSSDPQRDYRTVSDETLARVVGKVHNLGMKVVLLTPLRPDDGTWEGAIEPEHLAVWFRHWEEILVHYAKFSEEHGVEVLLLGSELPTLRGEPERWKSIIEELRRHFSGKLSFSVNFWTNRSEFEEVLNMTQWEDLDYIGITGYFELTPFSSPSVGRLTEAWSSDLHDQNVLEDLRALRDKHDKPVVFWEIGYQSKDGTNTYPWNYLKHGDKDEGEQKDSWLAFLRAIGDKEWIDGYMIFAEQVGLPRDKSGYHGYNVIRKEAETVFCNICG